MKKEENNYMSDIYLNFYELFTHIRRADIRREKSNVHIGNTIQSLIISASTSSIQRMDLWNVNL